jgi:hypothetical protein
LSIRLHREALAGIPGGELLTMQYADGGKTEVFSTPTRSVRLPAGAKPADVRAAFETNDHE